MRAAPCAGASARYLRRMSRTATPPSASLARIVGAAITIAACTGEATAPAGSAQRITIAAGAGTVDTIDARPRAALRVVVRDSTGRTVRGAEVVFRATTVQTPRTADVPTTFVGEVGSTVWSDAFATTTSASGEASVRVVMGQVAGTGGVTITVPTLGASATATYTIRPGNPVRVDMPVADTAIVVGRPLALRGRVVDREGNARSEPVTYEVPGSGVTVADGQVSANAPARALVVARSGSFPTAVTAVSVVPAATVAAVRSGRLVTVTLDGSASTTIPHPETAVDPGAEWHPDGQSLLAPLGTFGGPRTLYRVSLTGGSQRALDVTSPIRGLAYEATFSPDGQWMYVAYGNCNFASIMYRVPVGNTATAERLSPVGPDECFDLVHRAPSVSPDGTRLVFENQVGNLSGFSIRVLDVATRTITQLVAGGRSPRWSPAGDLIAYVVNNQVWVIKSDGTGARMISSSAYTYVPDVRWSPDGQWIMARFTTTEGMVFRTVALLNVTTRLEIPLPWTSGLDGIGLPSWRPTVR